jgi:hypothetical protein
MATYRRTTWGCEHCGYFQDFDPTVPGEQARRFPEFPGIPDGACPACYSGRNEQKVQRASTLYQVTDLTSATDVSVASDAELESRQVPELDANGQQVLEQVGERYELRVNQSTGEIYSEPVPVYEPKLRSLTDQELAELKLQAAKSRDALEAVAVKEVTQTKEELK